MGCRKRLVLSVFAFIAAFAFVERPTASAQCVAEPEVCDGVDNDCNGTIDDGTYGLFYSVFQQPSLTFPITPIRTAGTGAEYYGYGTDVARSSNTPDGIEREDKLVIFIHEAADGTTSLGLVFDEPIAAGGGISTATGGHAEVEILDTALVPVVTDDAEDTYGTAGGTTFEWDWRPGHTDGVLLSRPSGEPFSCVTISLIAFEGIDGILVVDGGSGALVPLDSIGNSVTICSQLCCTYTGGEVCDGQDNDCDRQIDEGILPEPTSCGVGVCAAEGELLCVDGQAIDTCAPGQPVGADDDCDGVDQNCNETADENYVPTPTSCGTGDCGNEGLLVCEAGVLTDTCAPLAGSAEVCDGRDNDCDGAIDEDLGDLSCGAGACENTVPACVDGQDNVCTPLPAMDEICDGRDNDCDESVDEGTYGVFFSVTQQPFGSFPVTAVAGAGTAADYYGYGTGVPRSANTPDGIEREDTLVLFMLRDAAGAFSLGMIFDEPVPDGGGISTATGGSASLNILDAEMNVLVEDDADDVFMGAGGTYFEWSWAPGHTDGGVVTSSQPLPFCFTIAPVALDGITAIAFFDGATMQHVTLDSTAAPITICSQLCCEETGDEICDGQDNDCDFAIDEDLVPEPTDCGVGACAATGELVCVDGGLTDTCTPGQPTGADDDCDGVDQNCNETADENYVATPTTCGTGACGNEGLLECVDGAFVDTCTPLGASPEVCNAVDDDCDGATDEDIAAEPTTCGTGACEATGQLECIGGQFVDSCEPGAPASGDATCNAVDDDCDGSTDEEYVPTPTTCGVGGCAGEGLLVCENGTTIDTCVPGAATAEVCDGVDNDCDGQLDEGFGTVSCGIGSCFVEEAACQDGQLVECTPGNAELEMCDGRDNDCDGLIDEDTSGIFFSVFQQPSQTFPVTAVTGTLSAEDFYGYDTVVPNSSYTAGGFELEDTLVAYIYEQTDGQYFFGVVIDEPFVAGGISQASGGRAHVSLDGSYDVVIQDDPEDTYPVGMGTQFDWRWGPSTSDGTLLNVRNFDRGGCMTITPLYFEKIYDLAMIDGATGDPVFFNTLSNPITLCAQRCCTPDGDEICDGIDNDCDGQIDEDLGAIPTECGEGVCAGTGVEECVDGVWVDSCVPGDPTGVDDDCDFVDNDCDGLTDEAYVPTPTECGVGACAGDGELICVDGELTDTCEPGQGSGELCDLVDNDCDGVTDEGFGTETCGFGECQNTVQVCLDGELQQCQPLAGQTEICDGRDNDCDGEIDEGTDGVFYSVFQQPSQTFSVTAIQGGTSAEDYYGYATAVPRSSNTPDGLETEDALVMFVYHDALGVPALGLILDEPVAEGGGISTATGGQAQLRINDDVTDVLVSDDPSDVFTGDDGTLFEWSWSPGHTDGAMIGMRPYGCVTIEPVFFENIDRILFVNGSSLQVIPFDSTSNPITLCAQVCCTPTGPEECNGFDDDCDGLTDEDQPTTPTECGVGECANTGELVCMDGEWVDTCEDLPGTEEVCNGIDDDCDGATDEDIPSTPTECGRGLCADTGELVCEGGEWVDTCVPGEPTDEICNGIDDDCDGQTDENYNRMISCGEGECYREVPACIDGVLQVCEPGEPMDEMCNGLDDDCDGETDEGSPEGWYYQVTQGGQSFPVQAVGGTQSAAEYYGYNAGLVPLSASTPDQIEEEDALVLFVHENMMGQASVGMILDEPLVMGGGVGISSATGGSAQLQVVARDAADLPLVLQDDASDGFDMPTANSASLLWYWNPGHTDGAVFGPFDGNEWCVDIYPGGFTNIDRILVVDGQDVTSIELGSMTEMVSFCKVTCCVPTDEVCNGMDDDCDELVDEDIPPQPLSCGEGECMREGEEVCEGGDWVEYCTPGEPTEEICDGLDNDCDGLTDEDLPIDEIECGVGDCLRTGTRECIDGEWVESCTPGEPCNEICDGHDNDCDGMTDEDLPTFATECGAGECRRTGEWVCVDGEYVDDCLPGDPVDEICEDGLDNDCDGEIDEGCYCIQHMLTLSDEYTLADGAPASWTYDENERWTAMIEDAIWIWDGYMVDDPTVDQTVTFTRTFFIPEEADAYGVPIGGIIEIAADNGYTFSVNGSLVWEDAGPDNFGAADSLSLFNLLVPGENTFTFTVTNYGIEAAVAPGNPAGLLFRAEMWFLGYPGDEICDGIDNDCDGFIDEDLEVLTCGVGACENTVESCWHGVPQECVPGEPGEEICDGIDNDCDGETDEDLYGDPVYCGVGACANEGQEECVDGEWVPFCTPLEPGEEICDGIDNDCDGETDEDLTRYGYKATQGAVSYWIEPLMAGENVVDFYQYGAPDGSSANTDPAVEASNRSTWFLYLNAESGLSLVAIHDEPNDGSGGQVALNVAGLTMGVGVQLKDDPSHAPDTFDVTTGDFTWQWNECCTDGMALGPMPLDLCVVVTPEMMQGLEGIDVVTMGPTGLERLSFPSKMEPFSICYEEMTTVCGEGECAAEGGYECIDGAWADTCEPGEPVDEICDALDNDCDGATDEDLYGDDTECGVGACADTGQMVCDNGEWIDTCVPVDPTEEICDGIDNDCDGATDEDLYGDATECGVGACADSGQMVCENGTWVDTCVPGDPTEEICDGIDNDCDGATDEDLFGDATECGVGACADTGEYVCENGEWVDTCVPGEPTEEICDGIDNDCDGATDEDLEMYGYRATQGGVTYWIEPVAGATDVADFYSYGNPDNASANTDPALEASGRSTWFLYSDPDGGLSLVAIHDEPNDGSGGEISLNIAGLDAGVTTAVQDDPTGGADSYDLATGDFHWNWLECCTDGVALAQQPKDLCVVVTPEMMVGVEGIDVLTQGMGGVERLSFPSLTEPFEICYDVITTVCGEGECAAEGGYECIGGEWANTCEPGLPVDEICDALDNDCDGLVDEELFGDATECGVGACADTGELVCDNGEWIDTCVPVDPTEEICDGIDNDCDGATDEELYGDATECGVGACADSGQMVCENGTWVDTCVPGEPTEEICDGIDNDCDGATDEDLFGDATECGVGECGRTGEWVCENGGWIDTCVPGEPVEEICDGLDNDCDGATDEELYGDATECGVGACADSGQMVCENGTWVDTCVPGDPTEEICDGIDNDCDGATDEELYGDATECGVGECADTGEYVCENGEWVDTCVPLEPGEEICDGLDNDCDGATDEGLTRYGYKATQGDVYYWIEPLAMGENVVDFYQYGAPDNASANTDPAVEASNRSTWFLYQDAESGLSLVAIHDEPNDGSGGQVALNVAGLAAGVGVQLKDDPSHAPDTFNVTTGDFTWQWNECCTDGVALGPNPTDLCVVVTPEMMQGIDGIDVVTMGPAGLERLSFPSKTEPFSICYEEMTTVCGEGLCAGEGGYECIDGEWADTCEPGVGTEEICDGIDNDCDGDIDEEIPSTPTSCGQGVCANDGELVCEGGEWIDTCEPLPGTEEICDGIDNDCDGDIDEEIPSEPTSCGEGVCANDGELTCEGGEWVDTCEPLPGTEEICDGIDNDCDGDIDEEIPSTPTSCGQGVCANDGELTCEGGTWVDTCEPLPGTEEICDGIDNDCDGDIDEELPSTPTSCGEGVCANDGELVCEGGAWVDTCEPGPGTEEICDGIDNDCDGLTDEDQPTEPTYCGEGECADEGELVCMGGEWIDTCEPGDPTPEMCDEVDNDCDGLTDEGCAFKLSEFVATSAERVGAPSVFSEVDTRAGSLELNYNGGHGYNGENTDFPWAAAYLTLRDGAGQFVEQIQVNRRWPPPLDEFGCTLGFPYPQCWEWPDGPELLDVGLPNYSTGSNENFDLSGDRVEVSGSTLLDYTVGEPMDNGHETAVVTWDAPKGLTTARVELRGRFDWDLDGLDADDVMIKLFSRGWGTDMIAPFVGIVAESETSITIMFNIKDAIDYVRHHYDDMGFFD